MIAEFAHFSIVTADYRRGVHGVSSSVAGTTAATVARGEKGRYGTEEYVMSPETLGVLSTP
jgi:hypothetical protein